MADKWEHEGGRKREFYNIQTALHRPLGRKVWEWNVLDPLPAEPPPDRDPRYWQECAELKRTFDRSARRRSSIGCRIFLRRD
jgi:hypothetical protein